MMEIDEDYITALKKTAENFINKIPEEVTNLDIKVIGNTLQISFIPILIKEVKK